jgi:hypothetical protein
MFNSTALEVAIGMALVYLLLSLFCTAINEAIAAFLGSRAKNLRKGIESLFSQALFSPKGAASANAMLPAHLDDDHPGDHEDDIKDGSKLPTLAQAIYDHGLVQSLYKSGGGFETLALYKNFWTTLPSYIPSRTFSSALIDLIFPDEMPSPPAGTDPKDATAVAKANLSAILVNIDSKLPDSKGKEAIKAIVKQAGGDVAAARLAFEKWYDDAMDRAAGWYKRKTQLVLFFIGLFAAVILNVNSVNVVTSFWGSPAIRSFAVGYADKVANDSAIKAVIAQQKAEEEAAKLAKTAQTKPDTKNAAGGSSDGTKGAQDPTKKTDKKKDEQKPNTPGNGSNATDTSQSEVAKASKDLQDLKSLNLPIGWKEEKLLNEWTDKTTTWPSRFSFCIAWHSFTLGLLGWFLTAIAMTLGAPFWFDTLNQFMVIRSTIKPREKSDVEGSKDSQKKS